MRYLVRLNENYYLISSFFNFEGIDLILFYSISINLKLHYLIIMLGFF